MVALLGAGAWGHNLLSLSNLRDTLLGRSRHHQGAQQLVFLLKEGVSSSAFDFGLHLGALRAAPGRLPGTSPAPADPAAGCPLEQRERARRDSLLLWKTSHVQSKFILGYSTGATIQHDHAERSLRWGEHRCPGTKQAQQGTVLGPLRSSPEEQSGAQGWARSGAGAGSVPVRQPASRTYTAAARAANKAAEPAHSRARLLPSQRR